MRILVRIQSIYYGITGIWALANVKNFTAITGNFDDPFKTETNGVLFLILGVMLWYLSERQVRVAAEFSITTSMLLVYVDFKYLITDSTSSQFWVDLIAESVAAAFLIFFLIREKYFRETKNPL